MRNFETGATRDSDESKYDYEGFLSPSVLEAYAAYMHTNRFQADGKVRDSDNWQKGIPLDAYMKSMFRHFMAVWKGHRNGAVRTDELAALMFNVMGYMHEKLKEQKRQIALADLIQDSITITEEPYKSPRARQNSWDDAFIREPEVKAGPEKQHYTHRYGALAHDAEAIAEETSEDPEESTGIIFLQSQWSQSTILYPHNEGYEDNVSSVARVDGGKVVGLSAERAEKQVEPLATKVQGVGRCQAPLCGCKW